MAKLVIYTDATTGKSGAVQPKKMLSLADITGGSNFKVQRLDNSNNEVITASDSAAALAVLMNAANTTDVHHLTIPAIIDETTGEVNASKTVIVDDIFKVIEDPNNASLSLIMVETAPLTGFDVVHASRSVAQVVTAANA